MADNTQESTRPLGKKPLPTRLIVNTDTGAADLYSDEGIFGRTKIAEGSASGNTWTVNDDFVKKYNNINGTDLTKTQLQGVFQKEYQSTLNNDRASIINKYSPYNTKTYLATEAKIPGVIDPKTGKTSVQTSQTVAPSGSSPNTADPQGGQPATTTVKDLNDEVKGRDDIRTSYRKNLSYPIKRSEKQDYIRFDMLEYTPKGVEANVLSSAAAGAGVDAALGSAIFGNRDSNRTSIGSVSLPISSPISDTNTVNWSDQSIDTLQAKAAGEALKLIGVGAKTNPQETSNATQKEQSSTDTKKLVGFGLANAAAGGNANLFTRATGAISNPNLELLFNGPSLRTFSFTFPLLARSKKESEIILQIIRFFKQGMSVKRSESALFLKSPHTFRIKYIYAENGKDHPWINRIKECALTNCSVNYTPAGNYATYANGAMTMYEITLNFSELEPIFDDDYASLDGNSAGKDTMVGY